MAGNLIGTQSGAKHVAVYAMANNGEECREIVELTEKTGPTYMMMETRGVCTGILIY